MSMVLGGGWHTPPPVEPAQWHVVEPELSTDDLRYEQLMVAMEALKDALLHMPAPRVEVAAPDLSAIVTAVTQLKGNATADDIARAVVSQITPGGEPAMDEVLGKLVKALERLDFRMKGGMGSGLGGGPATVNVNPDITDRPGRTLGKVEVINFPTQPASTEISNDIGNPVPVSGTVQVGNFPAAQTNALTETQLRSAPIVTADRDLRTSATLTIPAAITATGVVNTTSVAVISAEGMSGFAVQVTATTAPAWVGSVVTEYSVDSGLTWTATAWRQTVTGRSANTLTSDMVVANGSYTGALLRGVLAGATHYRVRLATNTAGSVKVDLVAHENTGAVFSNTVLDTRDPFQYLCSAAGGRVGFNATIDTVTTSTVQQILAAFRNPVGSGVDLNIYKIEFGGSVAGVVRRSRGGTLTVGTGQTPSVNVNRGGGPATSVAELYAGTRGLVLNTVVAGAQLSKVSYVGGSVDDLDNVDGTLTLRPGDLMSWTVMTAAGAGTAALDIAWAQSAAAV